MALSAPEGPFVGDSAEEASADEASGGEAPDEEVSDGAAPDGEAESIRAEAASAGAASTGAASTEGVNTEANAEEADTEEDSALRIRAGAVASSQVVGLGRDVVVDGRAQADVAAIGGSIVVRGTVEGDVIVLDGDVRLAREARVGGDVVVFGGSLDAAPGSGIEGRSLSYPTLSGVWLQLMEGPALQGSALAPTVLLAKLSLLIAWLVLVLVLFQLEPRALLRTAAVATEEPGRNFFTGLVVVITLALTAIAIAAIGGQLIALPLLVLVVVGLLVLKFWGMVALFFALGQWIGRRLGRRWAPLSAASVGLLVLGILKLIPTLGGLGWTLATFIGVGAAARTRLGRWEPWLEASLPDPERFPRPR
ncbi:MAG: hypothetical protein AAGD01_07225 [Acidobacteriota bacterium]